ncbi:hypothetical protein Misp01_64110 [Microtetraspora sp. NBRC 13810]|uniref:hypothetical protein n=1 Tax=Microtetraspora sp. NBRC 13810 TaxID=3030990 RepID=UPI0024A38A05|nr:hypothetical protein [Microtetraspora sp. NBRC 13810]GLW11283.1 hypothetical protein Misp01_64110 [Microtetraspora sp. NBRC 13810]
MSAGDLVRQRRIAPDQVSQELFGVALKWLFAGIEAEGAATGEPGEPGEKADRRSPGA